MVETVFQWPGLGLLVIQSIQFADVPLLAAYLVMIALGFAMLNLCSRSPLRGDRSARAHRHGVGEGALVSTDARRAAAALVGQRSRLRFPSLACRDHRHRRDHRAGRRRGRRKCHRAVRRQQSGERQCRRCAVAARLARHVRRLFPARHRPARARHALRRHLRPAHVAAGRRIERHAGGARRHSARARSAAMSAAGSTR